MEFLYLMIICSVSLAVVFLVVFIINAKNGQFEDDESPAVRMLLDDEVKEKTNIKTSSLEANKENKNS